MKYISAEQFQEQPKKVQKVLLKWWKPSIGDLCWYKKSEFVSMVDIDCNDEATKNLILFFKIPLFTEGHLREFIQYTTEYRIEISNKDYYKVSISKDGPDFRECHVETSTDIVQAYWKVACKIADNGGEI